MGNQFGPEKDADGDPEQTKAGQSKTNAIIDQAMAAGDGAHDQRVSKIDGQAGKNRRVEIKVEKNEKNRNDQRPGRRADSTCTQADKQGQWNDDERQRQNR